VIKIPQPAIGEWYRIIGGDLFEVVAVDEDDATIEIQHFDGTIEEMDFEEWQSQWEDGAFENAEAPEDWTGSVDIEPEMDRSPADKSATERELHSSGLEGIDLFEQ
jgi:hypothetical protein